MNKTLLCEASGIYLRNFSNTAEQKNLRITTTEEKEYSCSFVRHHIPIASIAQCQEISS